MRAEASSLILQKSSLSERIARYLDYIMKFYFAAATMISAAGLLKNTILAIPVFGLIIGAIWNFVDSVGGGASGVIEFKLAKNSKVSKPAKLSLAISNLIWSFVGMPALTTVGLLIGTVVAVALSSFAFGVAMFICAAKSTREYFRASKKSDPVELLKDRIAKFDILIKRIGDESCPQKDRMKQQAVVLYKYIKINEPKKMDRLLHRGAKFYGADLNSTKDSERIFGDYLIFKQQSKVEEKRLDSIAWYSAGIGATLTGLALLIPVAAPVLLPLAVAFYAVTTLIKSYQIGCQFSDYLTRRSVYKLDKYKGQTKEDIKVALIRDYFNDPKFDLNQLSRNDKKTIINLQCQIVISELEEKKQSYFSLFMSKDKDTAVANCNEDDPVLNYA